MKVFATVIFCILIANEARGQNARCFNPNQRPGLCVHINQCQTLYSVLNQARLSDREKQFLKNSACGMGADNRPYVCCTRDTGYTQSRRLSNFPDYEGFGGDWEEERPSTFAFPNQRGGAPWTFGNQASSNDRVSFQRPATGDGSSLLPQPPSCGGVSIGNRIYGGDDTNLNEFPWMVLLEYRRRNGNGIATNCAGSLINQRYVVTAAHCLTGRIEREIGTPENTFAWASLMLKPSPIALRNQII